MEQTWFLRSRAFRGPTFNVASCRFFIDNLAEFLYYYEIV